MVTRREFIRDGMAAFTVGVAAPAFLGDIALAQGVRSRNLVVIYLTGGNDALNTVVPYQDRVLLQPPTGACDSCRVRYCRSAVTAAERRLALHPRLTGLRNIFNQGRLAIVQRTGYLNSSRSHFQELDIWGTADPNAPTGLGWLGVTSTRCPRPSMR